LVEYKKKNERLHNISIETKNMQAVACWYACAVQQRLQPDSPFGIIFAGLIIAKTMPTARLFVRLNPVMLFADNEKAKNTPGFNRLKRIARAGSQVKPMLGMLKFYNALYEKMYGSY
jgi:hypothetical protein